MKRILLPIVITLLLLAPVVIYTNVLNSDADKALAQSNSIVVHAKLNPDRIFDLVNKERVKAGVKPFVRDVRLDATAQKKSDELQSTGVFEHVSPTGKHGYTYIFDAKIPECKIVGENLSMSTQDNQAVVTWWVGSKIHRELMLRTDLKIAGVAVTGKYVTLHMC